MDVNDVVLILAVALGGGMLAQAYTSMRILYFADRTLEKALAINDNELALSRLAHEQDRGELLLREAREKARNEGLSYAPAIPKPADAPDVTGNVGTNMPGLNV
jgi:hypothetical protein